jgi:hypothetical protein
MSTPSQPNEYPSYDGGQGNGSQAYQHLRSRGKIAQDNRGLVTLDNGLIAQHVKRPRYNPAETVALERQFTLTEERDSSAPINTSGAIPEWSYNYSGGTLRNTVTVGGSAPRELNPPFNPVPGKLGTRRHEPNPQESIKTGAATPHTGQAQKPKRKLFRK